MLGFNGGLLGKRRKQEATTPGLWFPNERAIIVGSDPYWDDVSLLLPMNGSNGSTTFTDSSSNALTVTANGNAQISTAQSKFGGASALFDGTGDYLSLGSSLPTALQIGGGNFTVEAWVYLTATTAQSLIGNLDDGSGNGSWWFVFNSTFTGLHTVGFYGAAGQYFKFGTSTLTTNQWVHVAISRSGTSLRCFVDGVQLGSTQTCNNFTGQYDIPTLIGLSWHNALGYTSFPFNGYIDDLRVTKAARYNANFTPPTAAFPTAG